MPVVKCPRCGAVATAHVTDKIETSYGASFREHCSSLAVRQGPDFVSSVTECPSMQAALSKLTARLSRQRAIKAKVLAEKTVASKVEAIS